MWSVYLQIGFWSCLVSQEFIATLGDQCFSNSRTKSRVCCQWNGQHKSRRTEEAAGVTQSGECKPEIFTDSRIIAQDADTEYQKPLKDGREYSIWKFALLWSFLLDKQSQESSRIKMGFTVGCETRIIPPYPDNWHDSCSELGSLSSYLFLQSFTMSRKARATCTVLYFQ